MVDGCDTGNAVTGGAQQPAPPPLVCSKTGRIYVTAFIYGDKRSNPDLQSAQQLVHLILNETLWLKHLAFFKLPTVAKDNRDICLMFNDVSKRGNGKEAAAGQSLSAHSSRRLLYMSTYESEIRESGDNVDLTMSVQSLSFVCVAVGCISACPPAREGLISLCPCGHRLHPGLHRGRLTAEVWKAIPRLCAGRTARRPL